MLAAAAGHEACVKELLYAGESFVARRTPRSALPLTAASIPIHPGANAKLKCDAGLTAEEWARKEGHTALADLIARGGEDESDDEVRARRRLCQPDTRRVADAPITHRRMVTCQMMRTRRRRALSAAGGSAASWPPRSPGAPSRRLRTRRRRRRWGRQGQAGRQVVLVKPARLLMRRPPGRRWPRL